MIVCKFRLLNRVILLDAIIRSQREGPPDAVHNCSQINATEDGMTIECAPGAWDGGLSNPLFTAEVYETLEGSSTTKLPPVANISTLGE